MNQTESNQIIDQPTIVELNIDLPKTSYIVLDVENNTQNNDIIQFAYIVYACALDKKDTEIKRRNYYVKDRFVDERAESITGITTQRLIKQGIEFSKIMEEFLIDINQSAYICGHHVDTDIKKIISNLSKFNIKSSHNVFESIKVMKTEKLFRHIFKKNTSLGAMYEELFHETMKGAHNAIIDVEYTAKCYIEMRDRINEPDFISKFGDEVKVSKRPNSNSNIESKIDDRIDEKIFGSIIKSTRTIG